ncbi:MAG: class A beta-lactamase-related serine hydrolase [Clostridia bacterium]|nr:class A beta-lactamase-related serine hydrolase [Clostridia bacterium]
MYKLISKNSYIAKIGIYFTILLDHAIMLIIIIGGEFVANYQMLDEYLDELVSNGKVCGCAVALQTGNERTHYKFAGLQSCDGNVPIKSDTLYRIYSMTKLVTVVAVIQLIEKNALKLEDALSDCIPKFKNMMVYKHLPNGKIETVPADRELTILDLLTMRSGISYAYDDIGPASTSMREAVATLRANNPRYSTMQYAQMLAELPLAFQPGTHFLYGASCDVLAAVVEVISGNTFGEYLEKNIFMPLEMHNTFFRWNENTISRVADIYTIGANKKLRKLTNRNFQYEPQSRFEEGGGGLLSTLDDYMAFAKMLCCGGKTSSGARLISEKSVCSMTQNYLNEEQLADFGQKGFGYGLCVRTRLENTCDIKLAQRGEFGWYGVAGSLVIIDISKKLTAVYMQQLIPAGEAEIHQKLRELIYGAI